jgi:hypothetical protein
VRYRTDYAAGRDQTACKVSARGERRRQSSHFRAIETLVTDKFGLTISVGNAATS